MARTFKSMIFSGNRKLILIILLSLLVLITAGVGISAGLVVATNFNIMNMENFGEDNPALPSQILDINGNLITEFFSDEKREIVSIKDLPESLIYALITREDGDFFKHNGFSLYGTLRAGFKIITGQYFSGGSTLTQQLAGHLYADRSDISVTRKLKELWWSFQLERQLTKYEIMELYINKMPFGHNTYGVEAASKFYFDHSAEENTVAESVMLVIQLVRPGLYSPIRFPEKAKIVQTEIVNQMVNRGYLSPEDAQLTLIDYWTNKYDWSRDNKTTAFFAREDKAPWFSEYIRSQLDEMLLGKQDIYRDGYIVHTTLNLDFQQKADELTIKGLARWNKSYQESTGNRMDIVDDVYVPIIDLLSLTMNIEDIRIAGSQDKKRAKEDFKNSVNPTMDMLSMMFGMEELKSLSQFIYGDNRMKNQQSTVQTAMITLDNETGYILAMVGGSEFNRSNQFNRAVDGELMPGSSFKPLYYSAAISSRKFTPATRIYDGPKVFWNPDGSSYTPMNYKGEWIGNVLLRDALANSMNVPAITVLDGIGFESAISRAARLLGYTDPQEIGRRFPRVYPLGLGVITVSPLRMAKAYATFPNQGRGVEPLAIRYVEDRNGNIILNPERDLRNQQKKEDLQIMSAEEAYIMVDLLHTTTMSGTLSHLPRYVEGFDRMPMGGKTGTTQNWADAWTAGFSPYYTTVMWAGFDQGGSTLGVNQTGATATGWIWGEYMSYINSRVPVKGFTKPSSGLVEMDVCDLSGMVPTDLCPRTRHEIFLAGTQPTTYCPIHAFEKTRDEALTQKYLNDVSSALISAPGVELLQDPYSDKNTSGFEEIDDNMIDFLLNDPFSDHQNSGTENTYLLD
ncbi:penicillin-binding protein 1A [Oceanispirochaeta sp.]|uniref:penicillin-binding protein 1A n=1 Tax=Oceanispirochaeta sp. TaxID=2035350 RepID=UPI0026019654|nr:PBP1A family penicillin-binding protein [Oceanispirochaeta sp.]MDA3956531.1 PBP1A family penicillin-binding protein [Oceanispirochaeta sp.]